ncbi:terminase small subunit [Acinetobacter puyangensis]|uniref:terminase small subunit n=1 Tax=Acinetobacter puyangensis TaxID=1096779 RepID=UPI003A4D448E
MSLRGKQQRFVDEYLIDRNATQAAIRAGYSAKTAYSIGEQNLKKLEIAKAIEDGERELAKRAQVSQEYVVKTIVKTIERSMQSEAVTDRDGIPVCAEDADGEWRPVYKFDAFAALKGAELLGKHLGMFKERIEHSNDPENPLIDTKTGAKKIAALAKLKRAKEKFK